MDARLTAIFPDLVCCGIQTEMILMSINNKYFDICVSKSF